MIYVKEDQYTEEQILDNNENSLLFDEFLTLLGDRVRLKGFDKYKGGLDTVHDLTGLFESRLFPLLIPQLIIIIFHSRSVFCLHKLA